MFKKTLLSILLLAAVSNAAVTELLPNLNSDDLGMQTQARLDLLAICSKASAPDAPAGEREAVSKEICEILSEKQPTVEVVQPLIRNLERIGAEEAVPTLAKFLSYKDEHVRDDARRALVANPSPEAGQALAAQLKMRKARSPLEIAGTITALGERGDEGASNVIAGYAGNKDDIIFSAAVKALGRLNEDAGIMALAAQRKKAKGFRKVQVDAALFVTERTIVFEKLYASDNPSDIRATALLGLLLAGRTELAQEGIDSGELAMQSAVIEAGLQGKNEHVLDVVASNLGQLPPTLQAQAATALAFSGNQSHAAAVQSLLTSDDHFIQDAAADALARIGTADSVEPLIVNGRPAAKRALGRLNADGVDKALETIALEGTEPGVRSTAIDALASRGRKDMIPTFFKLGEDDDRAIASAAVKAIGQSGDITHVEGLVDLMIAKEKSPVSRDALQAIVKITGAATEASAAIEVLVQKMDGASPRSQANILTALAQTGREEALEPLKNACFASDEKLQQTAVKALGGWPELNGIPVMLEVATSAETSDKNHIIMMRGVSRLWAGASKRGAKKADLQASIEACRRSDERAAIVATQEQLKN